MAAYEVRVADEYRRQQRVFSTPAVPAVVQPPQRDRDGTDGHQIRARIGQRRSVRDAAGCLVDLKAIARAADRARHTEDRRVVDERRRGNSEVQCGERAEALRVLGQLLSGVRVEKTRRDVLLAADLP